jgi:hypothetical protein
MKSKRFFKLLPVLLVFAAVCGCGGAPEPAPPPETQAPDSAPPQSDPNPNPDPWVPLTVKDLIRLNETAKGRSGQGKSLYDDPGQFQIQLSGSIVLLDRKKAKQGDLNTEGNVTFTDEYTIKQVTLNDRTPGIAMKIEDSSPGTDEGEIKIYVAFEREDSQLVFSAPKDNQYAPFLLKFEELSDYEISELIAGDADVRGSLNQEVKNSPPLQDSKGKTLYGTEQFYIKFTGAGTYGQTYIENGSLKKTKTGAYNTELKPIVVDTEVKPVQQVDLDIGGKPFLLVNLSKNDAVVNVSNTASGLTVRKPQAEPQTTQ